MVRLYHPWGQQNSQDLGAAAITIVILGARSYREGKVFHFDRQDLRIRDADASWAHQWEDLSHRRGKPHHIAGWKAGDNGSILEEPDYMSLASPWTHGEPPTSH